MLFCFFYYEESCGIRQAESSNRNFIKRWSESTDSGKEGWCVAKLFQEYFCKAEEVTYFSSKMYQVKVENVSKLQRMIIIYWNYVEEIEQKEVSSFRQDGFSEMEKQNLLLQSVIGYWRLSRQVILLNANPFVLQHRSKTFSFPK